MPMGAFNSCPTEEKTVIFSEPLGTILLEVKTLPLHILGVSFIFQTIRISSMRVYILLSMKIVVCHLFLKI